MRQNAGCARKLLRQNNEAMHPRSLVETVLLVNLALAHVLTEDPCGYALSVDQNGNDNILVGIIL
jgi:hypothetical protein